MPEIDSRVVTKILYVVTRLNIGGPASHTVLLTREMSRRGYETTLVSGVCEPSDGDMAYLLEPGDRVYWVQEMSRSVRPVNNLRALVRLWRLIRSEQPDVVHTHTAMAGCLGRVAAVLAGVPVIVHTFHGNSLRGYFSPVANVAFKTVERLLAGFTDVICVLSDQQLRELSDEFRIAPRRRFRIVPLGLNLSPFTQIEPPSLGGGRLRIGWFGRLVPVKNIPLLLNVVEATLAQTERVEFHIAGDGSERAAVAEVVKRHGPRVVWHGWQNDITPLMKRCHVLCQTSHNEGTPVALIQGMAAARPFVSTAVGGVVDMVVGSAQNRTAGCAWHLNGILARPDPIAFAGALAHLSESPGLLKAMGSQARVFAAERYQQEILLDNLDSLYRDLLQKKSRRKHGAAKILGATS